MNGKNFPNTRRGVTLVECCTTLAIVSILAGTAAPSFIGSNKKRCLMAALANWPLTCSLHVRRQSRGSRAFA